MSLLVYSAVAHKMESIADRIEKMQQAEIVDVPRLNARDKDFLDTVREDRLPATFYPYDYGYRSVVELEGMLQLFARLGYNIELTGYRGSPVEDVPWEKAKLKLDISRTLQNDMVFYMQMKGTMK